MKAALLTRVGDPLEIAEVETATPGPREVLIRTRACGACRSDLHFIDGAYPTPLPAVPGHEAAGAVFGCGGIGLAAIEAARVAGSGLIIAVDPVPKKRALAEKLGADHSFDPGGKLLKEQVIELIKGGVHHAIEAVGRIATGQLALSLLRRGGSATVVGMMPLREAVPMPALDDTLREGNAVCSVAVCD